jgi:hypothetical protein
MENPIPQYVFMAWYLVKDRDKFTFTFLLFRQHKYKFCMGKLEGKRRDQGVEKWILVEQTSSVSVIKLQAP